MTVSYRSLFAHAGVARVLISQLVARFPFGMMSLAFVMHIEHVHDSYAIAGIALGAETIGASISGPLLSRWISIFGARRLIVVSAALSTAAMLALALLDAPPLGMIVLAMLVGLTSPPIQAAVRTIYPSLVPKKKISALYALDATAQELIWIIGPVLATVLAAQISTSFAVIFMAGIQVLGGLWFIANREVGSLKVPRSSKRMGGVLKNRLVLANAAMGLLLVGSFSGVEVGSVAIHDKALAGLVIAALSVGSILGGFLFGPRTKTRWALPKYLALMCLGYALVFIAPNDVLWMSICWFVAGLGVAPALGALAAIIATSLKMNETAEAYGWIGTGQLMGYSAGAALAGIAIEAVSAESSLLIAIVFGLGCLLLSVLTVNLSPQETVEQAPKPSN